MPIKWMTLFLDLPATNFVTGLSFWSEVTGTMPSAPRGADGEFTTLQPGKSADPSPGRAAQDGTGDAYLRVQRVRDGAGGRHLDLHIDPAEQSLEQVAAQATKLGATVGHREPGLTVLDSPGGFRFCLVPWEGESRVPQPFRGARLDQLCLDIPPDRFEVECSFWAALTGWELRASARPEFAYLVRPAGMPVRLLFQRLADSGEKMPAVCGHLDIACGDPAPLVDEHVAAGARLVSRFSRWIVMADPLGQPYCLTGRDPLTGTLP